MSYIVYREGERKDSVERLVYRGRGSIHRTRFGSDKSGPYKKQYPLRKSF